MQTKKAKFTWHYYAMALGVLLSLMAATLSALGGVVSGLAFAIVSHPSLKLPGIGRYIFMVLFVILYVFSFPDPNVVREMMAADISQS